MRVLLQLLFFVVFLNVATTAQVASRNYNLDFKQNKDNALAGWSIVDSEGYDIGIDPNELESGTPSLRIKTNSKVNSGAGVLIFDIPDNFAGKTLTFVAKIKTENVSEDSEVGIYGHVQPKLDFKNLEDLKINGTQDWDDYSITLNLNPEETDKITIGLYLIGNGTVWFNNLRLFVDGDNYKTASIFEFNADTIYKSDSHVPAFELNNQNQKLLKDVALIWGAVKYFHPSIAQGKWNMDVELFKFLPRILSCQSQEQQEMEFINWIHSFGEILNKLTIKQETDKTKELKLKTDFAWISKLDYSNALKKILFQMMETERPDHHKYIDYFDGANHADLKELSYTKASVEDIGFRLLGLFRYWNIIQNFSPYRYLVEQPWDKVLNEFIPVFHRANTTSALDSAYLRLFSKINDGHAFAQLSNPYHTTVFGNNNVGFKIKIMDDKALVKALGVDSLEREKGLLVGDIISEIDDIPVIDYILSRRPFIAASNESTALKHLESILFQTNKDQLKIKFSRNNIEHIISIPTSKIESIQSVPQQDTAPFQIIDNRIGYIQAGKFKEKDLESFLKSMKDKEGIIIDYRQYPVDFLYELFSNYLFPEKKTFAILTSNKGLYPGGFAVIKSIAVGEHNPDYFKGKVVILIDEGTLSAAEFQTMAFQTIPDVTVIGRNSAGADGNISWIPLPLGYKTAFSGIGVYYPNGAETQGIGIVPDIYVEETLEDIKNNKDRILQTALDLF